MVSMSKELIGVVHLPAMPGDPRPGTFEDARAFALRDAEAYRQGGVETLVVENFGSAPFGKGDASSPLPPHQVAFMATLCDQLVRDGFRIGVNCLRNDVRSALGIAAATGASFVRVNVHTGAYVTDQGLIEGDAAGTLRYRGQLGVDLTSARPVLIAADILVKHATPLAPLSATQATEETLGRGLADAVIVSGTGTGHPVDLDVLSEVRDAAGNRPVWIGSGLKEDNVAQLAPFFDAAIVGTSVKEEGVLARPVDAARVRRLRERLLEVG